MRRLNNNRELEAKSKKMTVSPYAVTWQEDHYYLIGNYDKYDNLIHLRIDRMHSVDIIPDSSRPFSEVSEYKERFDIADYTSKLFLMHGGVIEEIKLQCDKLLIEQVADRFSGRFSVSNVTENCFCFTVKAAVSEGLISWIAGFGAAIRVIEPESLKNGVKNRAREILRLYENE